MDSTAPKSSPPETEIPPPILDLQRGQELAPGASQEGNSFAGASGRDPLPGGVGGGLVQGTGKRVRAGLQTWWPWLAAGGLLLTLTLLFVFNPARHAFYPQCFLYRVTGLSCPGCGGLRAVHQLLHGDVAMAFRFNPVFIAALPVTAWLVGRRLLKRPPLAHRTVALLAWLSLAVLIVFGVLRNLIPGVFAMPAG